jgi:aryl-alcohol dehydrogenase-like predicted oxidoreductase
MRYRKLGNSDLSVSEIALGSWWLTHDGGDEADVTRACTEAAFDAGITLFDTANVYGDGAAEVEWGRILSAHPRDSYVLATKVFFPMSETDYGLSAAQISKQIDASLKRLRVDYVDLYQAHRFDSDVAIEETIEGFQNVVASGKARYIGFSEWTPKQIQAAIDIAGPDLFVSSQPQYSMLWQAPEDQVMPLCAANGISQIVFSPLAQGVLTGKYRPGQTFPSDSRAAHQQWRADMAAEVLTEDTIAAVERLRPIAAQANICLQEMALAWVLRRGEVAAAIVGASRPEQLNANVKASGITLSPDLLSAIDDALADAPLRGQTTIEGTSEGITHRD